MRVFVTGHNGYIGTHLVELLKAKGYHVTGCDINLFNDCAWEELPEPNQTLIKDIRDLEVEDLRGYDVVMHLAAISNDPMGDINEELTYSVNREGSIRLAELAKDAGVPRFLFSGSCSVYGGGKDEALDETASLNPLSAYAHSKIATEVAVSNMADDDFSPAYLRNATAYGHSKNLRIDLVVNNLLGCAFSKGEIQIKSDGSPWRPLIHCRDIARAFVAFAEAPREKIHNKAINIGANKENFQVKDVANLVQEFLPDAKIVFTGEVGEDPRNYRVSFDALNNLLPDFKLEYDLRSGMKELFGKYEEHQFNALDFDGDQFVRLRSLVSNNSFISG